jgi:hypothetical protein
MKLLPFLLRVWLTGWVCGRLAVPVFWILFFGSIFLAWAENVVIHKLGLDWLLRPKTAQVRTVDHR